MYVLQRASRGVPQGSVSRGLVIIPTGATIMLPKAVPQGPEPGPGRAGFAQRCPTAPSTHTELLFYRLQLGDKEDGGRQGRGWMEPFWSWTEAIRAALMALATPSF